MLRTWPLYAKIALVIFLLYLLLYGLYLGQQIITPLGFAFLFAILLRPLEKRLVKMGLSDVLAIIISILVAIILIAALIVFLSKQITNFVRDIPAIQHNLENLWDRFQGWLTIRFHLSEAQQQKFIDKATADTMNNLKPVGTLNVITTSLATLILIPVYVFLFLYYRSLLLRFVMELFDRKHSQSVQEIIQEIRYVMQHYITGLLTETGIVAILNVIGLLIIGAPFAILLGIISAILNLIPYIGGLVAVVLTALITFTNTGSLEKMLYSLVIFLIVQLIDNNFLVPKVIASRVKLNALISIVGVLVGGALCGIGGMFLSIPLIAICKVIFDRVEDLKPWGKLLGDDVPVTKLKHILKKKKVVVKQIIHHTGPL